MFLLGRKIKGISIKTALAMKDEPLDDAHLGDLVVKLRSGDLSVVSTITEEFTRIAISIAGKYAALAPEKAQDLLSEAMLSIVRSCNKIAESGKDYENVCGYITTCIHGAIADYMRKDHLIPVTYRPTDREIEQPKVIFDSKRLARRPGVDPYGLIEIQELLGLCVEDEFERDLIELRSLDIVDPEIAQILGTNVSKISEVRNAIKTKFQQLERDSK